MILHYIRSNLTRKAVVIWVWLLLHFLHNFGLHCHCLYIWCCFLIYTILVPVHSFLVLSRSYTSMYSNSIGDLLKALVYAVELFLFSLKKLCYIVGNHCHLWPTNCTVKFFFIVFQSPPNFWPATNLIVKALFFYSYFVFMFFPVYPADLMWFPMVPCFTF